MLLHLNENSLCSLVNTTEAIFFVAIINWHNMFESQIHQRDEIHCSDFTLEVKLLLTSAMFMPTRSQVQYGYLTLFDFIFTVTEDVRMLKEIVSYNFLKVVNDL